LVSPNANTNADELAAVRLPGASHLAEATWVLHSAGIQIVAFKMDETAAYKQTILNSAEAWKNCAVVEDKILLPFVLGFGSCEGPSDYQRLSEVKHAILCHEAALLLGSSTSSNDQGGMWLYSPPSASMCNAVFKDRRVCSWIMFRASLFPNSPEQWLPFYLGFYLDDHNVLALGWEVAEWLISVMFETADKFGWILSSSKWEKEGKPDTSKILLGICYDFVSMSKFIPEDKAVFAQRQIQGFLRKEAVQQKELLSCLMRLINFSSCVPFLRLFLNEGFVALRLAAKGFGLSSEGLILISPALKTNLRWCISALDSNQGVNVVPLIHCDSPVPSAEWFTDASGTGVGGWMWTDASHTQVVIFDGVCWTLQERTWLDINTLEALGLLFAASTFGPLIKGQVVQASVDNLNVSLAWEKLKSHSAMSAVLSKLFLACNRSNLSIQCAWVPRECNQVADFLSKSNRNAALELLGSPKFTVLTVPSKVRGWSVEAIRIAKAFAAARDCTFSPGVVRSRIR